MEKGVVRFIEKPDSFYEGAYLNTIKYIPRTENWFSAWPLWLINSGYLWMVRKYVPAGSGLLEIGCASGVAYFGKRYRMIGMDLSLASLSRMVGSYETCIQADITRGIPLPDQSLDGIASSYFWEHLPHNLKARVLEECRRVLKPQGKLIFLYDVETSNPLIAAAKRSNPDLYKKLFLDQDGHVGYETPQKNKELFMKHGFRILEHRGMEKTYIQSSAVYEKLQHWNWKIKGVFLLVSAFGKKPWFYGYTALTRMIDETIGRLLPMSWARIVITVCEKVK